jgi:predicted DNA-binding transcriptional regulator AlpA
MPEGIQAPPYSVTISWVAKRLGVDRKTITHQLKSPSSPPPILVGKRAKWRLSDIASLFPGLVSPTTN